MSTSHSAEDEMIDTLLNLVLYLFALPGLILEWIVGSLGTTEFTPEFPV